MLNEENRDEKLRENRSDYLITMKQLKKPIQHHLKMITKSTVVTLKILAKWNKPLKKQNLKLGDMRGFLINSKRRLVRVTLMKYFRPL